MNLNAQHLKLDVTTLEIRGGSEYLAVLNFNVPADQVDDAGRFEHLLGRLANYLDSEFGNQNLRVAYQITSSYYLSHRDTGDERQWTGSFLASQNLSSSLSGPGFRLYDRESFLRVSRASCSPHHIAETLNWGDRDTDWQFSQLASVIFNVQAALPASHGFLRRNDLLPDGGRGQGSNRQRTISLPW